MRTFLLPAATYPLSFFGWKDWGDNGSPVIDGLESWLSPVSAFAGLCPSHLACFPICLPFSCRVMTTIFWSQKQNERRPKAETFKYFIRPKIGKKNETKAANISSKLVAAFGFSCFVLLSPMNCAFFAFIFFHFENREWRVNMSKEMLQGRGQDVKGVRTRELQRLMGLSVALIQSKSK